MPARRICPICDNMCSLRHEEYVTLSLNPVFGEDGVPDVHVHEKCLPSKVAAFVFTHLKSGGKPGKKPG